MHLIRSTILIALFVLTSSVSFAENPSAPGGQPASAAQPQEGTCEHGVKKGTCTRCNPNLSAVFKAKGDWCAEHTRPESQCVICHPELAAKGVK